jgi:hypothetical protein
VASVAPANLDRSAVGRLMRATAGGAMNGMIAECAWWDAALTDAEVDSLAKGTNPKRVRPSNLLEYVEMIGNLSPEPGLVGGAALTLNGPVKAENHPPVLR